MFITRHWWYFKATWFEYPLQRRLCLYHQCYTVIEYLTVKPDIEWKQVAPADITHSDIHCFAMRWSYCICFNLDFYQLYSWMLFGERGEHKKGYEQENPQVFLEQSRKVNKALNRHLYVNVVLLKILY